MKQFPSSVQIRASGLKGDVRKPDLCNFEESKYPRSHRCGTVGWGRRNNLIVLYIVFINMQYGHHLILKCHVPSYQNAAVPIIYRNACHPQLSHIVGVIATSVWGQLFNSCMASCHILYNTLLYTMQWQTTQSYRNTTRSGGRTVVLDGSTLPTAVYCIEPEHIGDNIAKSQYSTLLHIVCSKWWLCFQ